MGKRSQIERSRKDSGRLLWHKLSVFVHLSVEI
jgi:hypothetical protein